MDEIYNLKVVSKKLQISIRGLRELIRRGELRAKKTGRLYLVTKEELDRFLKPPKKNPETPGPDFLTVGEYSKRAGIPEQKVREWLRNGILKGAKGDRGAWFIDPSMIRWWKEIRAAIRPQKKKNP